MLKSQSKRACLLRPGTPGETRTHYLALRRRTLYPGELRRHNRVILTHGVINVNTAKSLAISELFVTALDFDFKKADNHSIIHLK